MGVVYVVRLCMDSISNILFCCFYAPLSFQTKAVKTLSGHRAPRSDKHQFRAKMTEGTRRFRDIVGLNKTIKEKKKERRNKKLWSTNALCSLINGSVL